jgi:ribosomal protein S18 acetylase RimI-like enzyme
VAFVIRAADLRGDEAERVGAMARTYLVQTEREKAEHGVSAWNSLAEELPEPYRAEVSDPARAYEGCRVFVADADGEIVGLVVVAPRDRTAEIKRLWADPAMRGAGIGSALLDAALASGATADAVRLTVWDWRQNAIRLYEARGFERVPSWDARDRLVCFQRGG